MFMDKNNPYDLLGNVSANALSLGLQALCQVKVLKKELVAFMSAHSSEKEEDIINRMNKYYADEFNAELECLSKQLGDMFEPLLKKVQENKKL